MSKIIKIVSRYHHTVSGDFTQILTVIRNRAKADDKLNASIKYPLLWKYFIKLTLTTYMRLQILNNEKDANYSTKKLKIGNEEIVYRENKLKLTLGNIVQNIHDLKAKV